MLANSLNPHILIYAIVFLHASMGGRVRAERSGDELFRNRVAAILAGRCVRCHGGIAVKGGLALTTRVRAMEGGKNGPVIVPGKADESALIDLVSGDAPEMPKGGKPLAREDVEALKSWIDAGAPWPVDLVLAEPKADPKKWWAFQPLDRPPVPRVRNRDRVRNPIDAFVLEALEKKRLTLSPEADRRTLIRRLAYDLLGLPPEPAEIDAFLNDRSPDAYERLVDRMLASPRYGERWARHWLDVVHYGDTHGYDKDKRRDHSWPYRDYVINAFNLDKPYGRFVREQVAGDILFPDDPDAVVATGFVAAGPWDYVGNVELREGTVDKDKTRLTDRDDMLANTISTFSSLTVHCARCHDHKFDPIPQRDYYRLQAVFAGVDRGDRPYPDRDVGAVLAVLDERRVSLASELAEVEGKIRKSASPQLAAIDAQIATLRSELAVESAGSARSKSNGYHSAIEPKANVSKWVQVDLGQPSPIDEIRLIPARPVDFADTPGFGFPERFRVEISDDPTFARNERVEESSSRDVANPGDLPWVIRLSGKKARFVRVTAERLWKRTNDYVFALAELEVFRATENLALGKPVSALDSIEAGLWGLQNLTDASDSRHRRDDPVSIEHARKQADAALALRQDLAVRESLVDPKLNDRRAGLAARIEALDAERKRNASLPLVYALVSHSPRPIHLLRRGDVEQPGEPVGPGALSCLSGLESAFAETSHEGERRASLANWLANPKNVLTWRSIVNRVWHYHFGRGIVETPNDFGTNGSTPTHPELLDWLACEFMANGQSLKSLHRLIVTSTTYRQSSANNQAAAKVDGENRWLWRRTRRRLDAESIRDTVLSVAGVLDLRMGGPGFELFRFKDDHSPIYDHDDPARIDPPEGRRRSVYRFVVRSVPNPFVECLDGADPNTNVPVRNTTITPLQALALANDPFMLRQAENFAARLERDRPDPCRRIDQAYALALGRPPTDHERHALAAYAKKHGLANACRLLFNLNEFLFVD